MLILRLLLAKSSDSQDQAIAVRMPTASRKDRKELLQPLWLQWSDDIRFAAHSVVTVSASSPAHSASSFQAVGGDAKKEVCIQHAQEEKGVMGM